MYATAATAKPIPITLLMIFLHSFSTKTTAMNPIIIVVMLVTTVCLLLFNDIIYHFFDRDIICLAF